MLAETAQELLELFRAEVKDDKFYTESSDQMCLWSDSEILSYMSEACDSLATRTNGITEVIQVAYEADATYFTLPPRVLHIYEARLVTADIPLDICNNNSKYRYVTDVGRPWEIVRDGHATRVKLYPIPTENDTVEMVCSVTLRYPLEADDDVPFTKAEDQRLLLEFMKWRAYSKQDAETEDLVRARRAQENYLSAVADRESDLRNQRRGPGLIRMDW